MAVIKGNFTKTKTETQKELEDFYSDFADLPEGIDDPADIPLCDADELAYKIYQERERREDPESYRLEKELDLLERQRMHAKGAELARINAKHTQLMGQLHMHSMQVAAEKKKNRTR